MKEVNYIMKTGMNIRKKAAKQLSTLSKDIKSNNEHKRIRIEFNDITDIPEVYIDGKFINPNKTDSGLVSLNIDWITNDIHKKSKSMNIKYMTEDGIQELSQKVTSYEDDANDL